MGGKARTGPHAIRPNWFETPIAQTRLCRILYEPVPSLYTVSIARCRLSICVHLSAVPLPSSPASLVSPSCHCMPKIAVQHPWSKLTRTGPLLLLLHFLESRAIPIASKRPQEVRLARVILLCPDLLGSSFSRPSHDSLRAVRYATASASPLFHTSVA